MAKTGYVNGSDMLLYIGEKAIGHCSTHTTTFTADTKDRAVKPVASASITAGLWKEKSVSGLSVSISAEGFCFYEETETGFKSCLSQWSAGQTVTAKCMERDSTTPYLTGNFVISSLERTDPAQDDATYTIQLENSGEVTFDETAITETATTPTDASA